MKTLFTMILMVLLGAGLSMFYSKTQESNDQATPEIVRAVPKIPMESEDPFDFRGRSNFTYPPYEKLFETQNYVELRDGLRHFFRQWEADGREVEDGASMNIYARCQLALVRAEFLLGHREAGSALLHKLHPAEEGSFAD